MPTQDTAFPGSCACCCRRILSEENVCHVPPVAGRGFFYSRSPDPRLWLSWANSSPHSWAISVSAVTVCAAAPSSMAFSRESRFQACCRTHAAATTQANAQESSATALGNRSRGKELQPSRKRRRAVPGAGPGLVYHFLDSSAAPPASMNRRKRSGRTAAGSLWTPLSGCSSGAATEPRMTHERSLHAGPRRAQQPGTARGRDGGPEKGWAAPPRARRCGSRSRLGPAGRRPTSQLRGARGVAAPRARPGTRRTARPGRQGRGGAVLASGDAASRSAPRRRAMGSA